MNPFVYIIESPHAEDLLAQRAEGLALTEMLKLADIAHCYSLVTTKETFITALYQRLVEALKYMKKLPILHLSMHGNYNGVCLTDKTLLSWDELKKLLEPLIKVTEGQLLICISSCKGGYAAHKIAELNDKNPPYLALIGSEKSIDWSDACLAYATFYHLLFKKNMPLQDCCERMKLASGDESFQIFHGDKLEESYSEHLKKVDKEVKMENLIEKLAEIGSQYLLPKI